MSPGLAPGHVRCVAFRHVPGPGPGTCPFRRGRSDAAVLVGQSCPAPAALGPPAAVHYGHVRGPGPWTCRKPTSELRGRGAPRPLALALALALAELELLHLSRGGLRQVAEFDLARRLEPGQGLPGEG